MNLGLFLAIGESIGSFKRNGQFELLYRQKIEPYAKCFNHVYIFSYANEQMSLKKNITIVPNRYGLNRYIYALLMPLIHFQIVKECAIFRGLQLTGGFPAVIAKLLLGKKFVINYGYHYDQMALLEGKKIQFYAFKISEPFILRLADFVIATTKVLVKYLETTYSLKKVIYVPNAVDTSLFRPLEVKKAKMILFIGRLEKTKNLSSLIKAMALLKRHKLTLLLVGSGSQKKELSFLARQVGVAIKIIDFLPQHRLPQIINKCICFVLPSVIEGHPKVLLEVMSCAVPVVATKIPSVNAIITHNKNGLLCATDSKSIAREIKKILTYPSLRIKLGKNARKHIISNFDEQKWITTEIDLLKTLLAK